MYGFEKVELLSLVKFQGFQEDKKLWVLIASMTNFLCSFLFSLCVRIYKGCIPRYFIHVKVRWFLRQCYYRCFCYYEIPFGLHIRIVLKIPSIYEWYYAMNSRVLYNTFERSSTPCCDSRVALTFTVYLWVVTSLVSEHNVMQMVLGCLKTTSSKVLLIGVSHETSMSWSPWVAYESFTASFLHLCNRFWLEYALLLCFPMIF